MAVRVRKDAPAPAHRGTRQLVDHVGTVPGAVAPHLRITEALVHGWDLARAVDAPYDPPARLVEPELAMAGPLLSKLSSERRVVAPSQPADDSVRPIERLVALLGRTPASAG